MRAINLFGGPGGFCEAGRDLGLDVLGIEHDPQTCATRLAAGHPTVGADVSALDPSWFAGVDGLIASPPCPPFSRAGKRLGAQDLDLVMDATRDLAVGYERRGRSRLCRDERSILVCEPWRWTLALEPRWLAFEQVPDVLSYWRFVAEGLDELGYSTWVGILNASDYGTPQTRRRAILIASRDREVRRPEPTHADARKGIPMFYEPWVSMADALGWTDGLPAQHDRRVRDACEPAPTVCGDRVPRWAYSRPALGLTSTPRCAQGLLVYGEWRLRNGNQPNAASRASDGPAPTIAFGHNANRVEWVRDRPATMVLGTPRVGRPGHKAREHGESQFASDAVPVTMAEAAILQDFPSDYPFCGNKSQRFSQIGNAVPVRLGRAILAEAAGLEVAG